MGSEKLDDTMYQCSFSDLAHVRGLAMFVENAQWSIWGPSDPQLTLKVF